MEILINNRGIFKYLVICANMYLSLTYILLIYTSMIKNVASTRRYNLKVLLYEAKSVIIIREYSLEV